MAICLAARRLSLTRTTFIGVTGSCAKTTTALPADGLLTAYGSCYQGCSRSDEGLSRSSRRV